MGFLEDTILEPSRKRPVLVDFWAPWCGPCRTLGPVLDRVAAKNPTRFTLVKVDTDQHQDIAARFRVQSIPAVKLFDQAKVIAEFVGALPEREVLAWLDRVLPTDEGRALAAAKEAMHKGDRAAALAALHGRIHEDTKSSEARALYAVLAYFEHREHALALAATVREGDVGFDLASAVTELDGLDDKVEGKPEAVASYQRGIASFKAANFGEAAAAWIESMKLSRQVAQDGAKRALIALFKLLGEQDPVTLEYRRAFASALY
ncbi:MAG: tetratricopeptide repeat protein [Myxococcota bacterium]|nr:tetratricopeptide repeat protein [Myxococcota bacterium]